MIAEGKRVKKSANQGKLQLLLPSSRASDYTSTYGSSRTKSS